jgi:hypothetical protein
METKITEAKKKSDILTALDAVYKDTMKGGEGDKAKPSDFDEKQILKGIVHELEHSEDSMKALEISMDHLTENPAYYDDLEQMEAPFGDVDEFGIPSPEDEEEEEEEKEEKKEDEKEEKKEKEEKEDEKEKE